VPESFGERYILPGLAGFLGSFPLVSVELVSNVRHVRLVEEEFDLAIRMAETPAPSLVARRIGTQRLIVVAAPSYLTARGAPTTPGDLIRHHCVGTVAPLPWHDKWHLGDEEVAVTPRLAAAPPTGCGSQRSPVSAPCLCLIGWSRMQSPPGNSRGS
jgi:DNA-binding transcriptional LysR family regulator